MQANEMQIPQAGPLVVPVNILTAYHYPTPDSPAQHIYQRVKSGQVAALRSFCQQHPLQTISGEGMQ